jgi:hypothetical protein
VGQSGAGERTKVKLRKTASYEGRFSKAKQTQILLSVHLRELFPHCCIETEYQFATDRKWRFDAAVPSKSIAIEIEGGHWAGGAHVRGKHFESDMEKYNRAALYGWRVLRFSHQQVLEGEAKAFIERYL